MLLILAGVALATLTGQGNIIGNAENAVGKYNNSVASEQQLLNEIEKYFQNYLEGGNEENPPTPPDPVEPPKVNEDGLAIENTTIKPEPDSDIQIVIPAGFAPAILKGSDSTYSLPGQDGSVKEIMPAEEWYSITAEQINQGIVIVDNAITYDNGQPTGTIPDFNEYVWVPIAEETDFDRIAWDGPYWITSLENGVHQLSDIAKENCFWENEPDDMINSVNFYKGFYIGRYEASNNGNDVAQSKRNQPVWNNISQTRAIEVCSDNSTPNMHLVYGIEWDSTLKWLINNAIISANTPKTTKRMELADAQNNSSTWGNYSNSIGDAETDKGTLWNTGHNEVWKANNIYDLAGNAVEWTQEVYSTDGTSISYRGGDYNGIANGIPAASRYIEDITLEYYDLRISCKFFYNS